MRLVAFVAVHGLQIAPPYIVHSSFVVQGSVHTFVPGLEAASAPASPAPHAPASFGAASGKHFVPLQSPSTLHV
jgi:hypothetical protein